MSNMGPKVEARKQTRDMAVCPSVCVWWEGNITMCALHKKRIRSADIPSSSAQCSFLYTHTLACLQLSVTQLWGEEQHFCWPFNRRYQSFDRNDTWRTWHIFSDKGFVNGPFSYRGNRACSHGRRKTYLPAQERAVWMVHYQNCTPSQIPNN